MANKSRPKACAHPLNQRIGRTCSACGAVIVPKVVRSTQKTVNRRPLVKAKATATDEAQADLLSWWFGTAQEDAKAALAKAEEYGSRDLEVMAAALRGYTFRGTVEEVLAFYLLGKAARMFAPKGASEDSVKDAGTYAMMMRRIAETGRWP